MTQITRNGFVDNLLNRPLKVNDLKAEPQLNDLNLEGVDRNADGVIGGSSELKRLFAAVDHFDRDGSYHSMSLEDRLGAATRSGDMVEALERLAPAAPPRVARPTGRLASAYQEYRRQVSDGVNVRSSKEAMLNRTVALADRRWESIDAVARRADVPPQLVAAIWYREDSQMRTSRYLHNGQPLGRTTTIVPRGIFFRKDQFVDAAVHALGQKNYLRNALGLSYESRDLAAMAAYTEAYNGFGYRMGGRPSPYVTAATDKYSSGLYVRDGVFDRLARDERLGTLSIMNALIDR
ncbi:MAG: hypothetical protein VYB65_03605 [Myxococcota bacterium]|nr:hypothetical protein [Myxococcota bacterium]